MRSDSICATCYKYLNGCVPKTDAGPVVSCNDYSSNIAFTSAVRVAQAPTMEVPEPKKPDMVNHPPHYTKGGIECLDAIRASMTDDEYKGYLKGNIIKYLWRYEWKNGLEDLKKAQFYQNKLIEIVQAEKVRGDSMHT